MAQLLGLGIWNLKGHKGGRNDILRRFAMVSMYQTSITIKSVEYIVSRIIIEFIPDKLIMSSPQLLDLPIHRQAVANAV